MYKWESSAWLGIRASTQTEIYIQLCVNLLYISYGTFAVAAVCDLCNNNFRSFELCIACRSKISMNNNNKTRSSSIGCASRAIIIIVTTTTELRHLRAETCAHGCNEIYGYYYMRVGGLSFVLVTYRRAHAQS